jgi:predicted MFS family arabinose efflux permease
MQYIVSRVSLNVKSTENEQGAKVLLLALCQGLMMTGNSLLMASSALIGSQLATNKALATLPLALQFLSTMLTSIPASLLMGRIGRRRGFMLGSALGVCGAIVGTFAILKGSFPVYCLATALIGSSNGFAIYYRLAAADDVSAAYRSRAISLVLAGGVIAAFIGPNLANWTRDLITPAAFAGSFAALVGVYVLSLLLLSLLPSSVKTPKMGDASPSRTLQRIAAQPMFLVAVACGMLGYAVMTLIMTATPLAMQVHDHIFADTAFVIQWHVFAMFAPSFVTGHLIKRFGVLNIMMCGALLDALCVAVNLWGHAVWHVWAALMLLGVGWNFLFVGASTLLTNTHTTDERAKTQGLNDFIVFTTVAASALSAGALQHSLGWQWVNIAAIPAIIVVSLALVWLKTLVPRPVPG